MEKLKDRIALVTGGAKGMGASHVRELLGAGAIVYFTDIDEALGTSLQQELGVKSYFIKQDVSKEADWSEVTKRIEAEQGHLDILVNNAGILIFKDFGDMTLDQYMKVININQVSVFLGITYCLPLLKKSKCASIINISSIAGLRGSQGDPAYASSKFAVTGMTQTAAAQLAKFNIRVNSIHPGAVETSMIHEEASKNQAKEFVQYIPLRRIAKPREVSKMVLFLASDDSSYSTGGAFLLDGGSMLI